MSKGPILYGLGCVTGGCCGYLGTTWWQGQQKQAAPTPRALPATSKGSSLAATPLGKWGVPSEEHLTVVGDVFASSDNWQTRCPTWVLEHLKPETLKGDAAREKSNFKAAPEVPEHFRSTPGDYRDARKLGDYVRGHLVPAADMRSDQEAMDATFLLNHNVIPQDGVSNGCSWFYVESLVRKTAKKNPQTWALSGPVFKPKYNAETGEKEIAYKLVGKNDVAVPTHLFKVIVSENSKGKLLAQSFIVPNSPCDEAPEAYRVPMAEVERLTGLEIFKNLKGTKMDDLCSHEKCTEKARVFKKKPVEAEA